MVVIGTEDQTLKITISDNGKGAESLQRDGHYGVRGMQERASAFGGDIVFGSGAEGGLAVRVTLPLVQPGRE
jgi:signal transduction histidine kinase